MNDKLSSSFLYTSFVHMYTEFMIPQVIVTNELVLLTSLESFFLFIVYLIRMMKLTTNV